MAEGTENRIFHGKIVLKAPKVTDLTGAMHWRL